MRAFIDFLKDILMIKKEDKVFIGLSQFKYSKAPVTNDKPQIKKNEVKISDLMRRSY